MRISVEPGEKTAEVRHFIDLVWPPGSNADSPVAHIVWDTNYAFRILARDDEGAIVSHIGAILRHGIWNGSRVLLGGVGHVGTHPLSRGQGYATQAMEHAARVFGKRGAGFAALFCATETMAFYERFGWRRFDGSVFIEQPGNDRMPWSNCMTFDIKLSPRGGVLELCGKPW